MNTWEVDRDRMVRDLLEVQNRQAQHPIPVIYEARRFWWQKAFDWLVKQVDKIDWAGTRWTVYQGDSVDETWWERHGGKVTAGALLLALAVAIWREPIGRWIVEVFR